jgi:hypothetical protein
MSEDKLNELLQDAGRTWLEPKRADYDAMWERIDREAVVRRGGSRAPSWRIFSIGVAAALVMGVGVGRFVAPDSPSGTSVAELPLTDSASPAAAYDRVASELLGRTILLLTSLPDEGERTDGSERFATQATELLTSTRLLLDSPAADDIRMQALLEDLELVLAQIAMLQTGRAREDIDFITDALLERDVVPRIRTAAARLAMGD